MPVVLIEARPLFDQLIRLLAEHGAGEPGGWQVGQAELATLLGVSGDRVRVTLYRAKAHDLVTTTPNVTGGGFHGGTQRAADSYHLKVTVAEWEALRPGLVAKLDKRLTGRLAARSRAGQMERSRKVRAGERALDKTATRPVVTVPVDPVSVAARVAQMDDDEDLIGW